MHGWKSTAGDLLDESSLSRFLFEVGQLKRVQRSGWWLAGVRDAESVAEHSHRTALIAFVLAKMEGVDAARAATIALVHDMAETRVNDLHKLAKKYVDWAGVEERVVDDQVANLPDELAHSLRDLWREKDHGDGPEAQIVRDADHLECLLQACEYAELGHDVDEWIENSLRSLRTASGKKIAQEVVNTPPGSWRESGGS